MQWITFNFTSPALAGNCTDCNMFFYRSKWCNIAMLLFLLSSSSLIRQMLKRGVVNQNYRKEPTCQLCHIFFISSKHTCQPSHVIFKYTLILWSLFLIHLLIDFHVSHFGSCRIIIFMAFIKIIYNAPATKQLCVVFIKLSTLQLPLSTILDLGN